MTIPVPNQGQDPWYNDLVASFSYIDGHFSTLGHTHTQAESHNAVDTDASAAALHHTIGTGAFQAAAGNHTHTQAQSHNSADTDTATTAIHHTLGTGANQAAAGNHTHSSLPVAHASTHIGSGSDPIPAFTSTTSGLAPASGGGTTTFLRADGLWATPAGGGGGTVDHRMATAYVYGSTFPSALRPAATDSANYIWLCDGSGDEVEINAAIAAVNAIGAGMVVLMGEFFSINNPIQMYTGVHLRGESIGCEVRANATMTALVVLHDDGHTGGTTTHATELSHLYLNGNNKAGTHGIYYNNYGASQAYDSQPPTNPDSAHRIHDLIIKYTGSAASAGHGIILWDWSTRANIVRDIRVQSVTGSGVIIGSADSHFENIEVGSSAGSGPSWSEGTTPSSATPTFDAIGHGFVVYNGNNLLVNCKAWYSRGHGFYVKTQSTQLANCQAQDNYRDGFKDTGGRNTYANCEADSNNQAGTGSGYAGFRFSGSSVQAIGCLSFDRGGQAWKQDYGIVVSSGATYSYIQGVTKGNNTAGLSSSSPTGSTVTVVSDSGGK